MRMTPLQIACPSLAALMLVATTVPAQAYVGPGLGLGAASTALGVLGAIFLGILAFIWYPIKRMLRMVRGGGRKAGAKVAASQGGAEAEL